MSLILDELVTQRTIISTVAAENSPFLFVEVRTRCSSLNVK